MNTLAPIIIFTYNRLDTLILTINALTKANLAVESEVFIFSDGAKHEKDNETVDQIRAYIKEISGFKSLVYFFSETNKGLAKSIISGVSKVLETHSKVIVLEDDLIVTTNFLVFMNKSLERYKTENNVFSISGFSFNLKPSAKIKADTYFLNRGWSWGWATWKNRWDSVDWEVKDYNNFRNNKSLQKQFNAGGSDLTAMLDKQMNQKLDSWAIRWFFHQFNVAGLTLYPIKSKVSNNGFGKNATHTTGSSSRYEPVLDDGLALHFNYPEKTEITQYYQKLFQLKMGVLSRIKSKIETYLIKISNFCKL